MQKVLILFLFFGMAGRVVAGSASLLVYQVWETGIEPYLSRVIVNEDYVRLDEGEGGDGYSLYDRQQEILYNVVTEDQAILVMNPATALPEANEGLILQEQVTVDSNAPMVAGQRPREVKLLANGEVCSELVVIDGVMEDAVEGLSELKLTLARIQASTLENMPLEMRTPCSLSSNIYAADRSMRFGLPLQERSSGRSQSLVDFSDDFEPADDAFKLPADFARRPMFAPAI